MCSSSDPKTIFAAGRLPLESVARLNDVSVQEPLHVGGMAVDPRRRDTYSSKGSADATIAGEANVLESVDLAADI